MRKFRKIEEIKWFSVEEKSPKTFETILIMCDFVGRTSVGYFDGERFVIAEKGLGTRRNIGCTYWAYLPLFYSDLQREENGQITIK